MECNNDGRINVTAAVVLFSWAIMGQSEKSKNKRKFERSAKRTVDNPLGVPGRFGVSLPSLVLIDEPLNGFLVLFDDNVAQHNLLHSLLARGVVAKVYPTLFYLALSVGHS